MNSHEPVADVLEDEKDVNRCEKSVLTKKFDVQIMVKLIER